MMVLADGRFPSGGHAHSNGYEAALRSGSPSSRPGLDRYIQARLATSGVADGVLVAAVVERLRRSGSEPDRVIDWEDVDAEVDARLLGPALRARSRSLGRQWLRAGRRLWPNPHLDRLADGRFGVAPTNGTPGGGVAAGDGPHEVVAFGVVAWSAGLDPLRAVMVHLHHLVSGMTTAAIRLKGLDPYELQAVQLAMVPVIEELAVRAESMADQPLAELPAPTGPRFEILSEAHAGWDDRLFQS